MFDWGDMELGEFVELKRGYDLPKKNREEGIVPLVSSSGESDFHNVAKVKGPGVVTGRYGTIGKVFYIADDFWPLNTTLYVKDFKGNDPLFVYYFLKTISYSDYSDKAAVPGINRNHLHKAEIRIPVDPGYQRQLAAILWDLDRKIELNRQTNQTLEQIAQAIFKSWFVDFEPVKAKAQVRASVAQGYLPNSDQKIPLPKNFDVEAAVERAAMCAISGKSLEELEQLSDEIRKQLKTTAALFPDALVESELGEIPEGWEITELGELLEFNPKRTLKKGTLAPYLDMKNVPTQGHLANNFYLREMASGTKFINGDTLLARITPCLENGKTAYVDFLEEDQVGWGSTEYIILRPKNDRPMSLGYMIARLDSFRTKAIQTMTGTSGRQRANAKGLSDQLWVNYPVELLKKYDLIAGSYLYQAKINGDENKILSELRGSLLPKLLSGELSLESTLTTLEDAI